MKNNQFLPLTHQYQIDKTQSLGKGSTGEVYLGKSLFSNLPVAIKVIRLQTIDNEVTQYLLKMEKTALQTIIHENVLRGLKIIENATKCYIITEYCNGGTLKQLIKKQGSLSESKSLEVIKGILRGYSSLVRNKIVHRDLKPANIMFHNNIPKIIDFGYCQIQGYSKPSLQYNVGSPSYMAPESFENNVYNEKTQIWAIGIILYECLMGKTFDDGKHMSEVFKTIKKYGIPYGRQVSDKCRKIISWCLQFRPEKRPSSLELLKYLSQNKSNEPQFMILEKGRTKINSLFVNLEQYQSIQFKRNIPQIDKKTIIDSQQSEQRNLPAETRKLGKKLSVKCQQKSISDEINTKASQSNSKSKQQFGIITKKTGMMKKVQKIQHQFKRQTFDSKNLVQNQYGLNNSPVYKTQKYFTGQNVHNKLHTRHVSAFSSVMASPRDYQIKESNWMDSGKKKQQRNPECQKQKPDLKCSQYSSPLQQKYNDRFLANSYRPMIRHQEISNSIKNENFEYISRQQPLILRNSGEFVQQRQTLREDRGSYSVYQSIPVLMKREKPSNTIYQLNHFLIEKDKPISIFSQVPQRTFR